MADGFDIGSVTARIKADISGFQEGMAQAKESASGFGEHLNGIREGIANFAETAAVALAAVGVGFEEVGRKMLDTASTFEQTQTSFGTLLGSEQKAADLMKEIISFEQNTPFDIGTLADAAKNLLAFGVAQKEVVPHLKEFTDMSQGQTYKLKELVSIYGEVNSIQSLNGKEVLRLSSIGIPIYEALAKHFNDMGANAKDAEGKIGSMTGSVVNNSKMTESARIALTDRMKEEEAQLAIDEQKTGKTTLAKEQLAKTIMSLKDHIAEATQKLGTHTDAVGALGAKAKVTADDIRKMISEHKINGQVFDDVLTELTSKGGLFFNENIRQMSTFSGIMTSVSSQFQYLALSIMGIDIGAANEVKKGGLFYMIREAAANLLDFLKNNREAISSAIKGVFEVMINVGKAVMTMLKPLIDYIGAHKDQTILFLQGLAMGFAALLVIIPVLLVATNPMILLLVALEAACGVLYVAWNKNFLGIRDITTNVFAWIGQLFKDVKPILDREAAWWKDHWEFIKSVTTGAWNILKGVFEWGSGIILAIFGVLLGLMTGNWDAAWKYIKEGAQLVLDGVVNALRGFVTIIIDVGKTIFDALTKPFRDAYNAIVNLVDAIKDRLDFTKRHSPSVLDIVQNGVGLVNEALQGIQFTPDISTTQIANNIISPLQTSVGSGISNGYNITIQLPNAIISDNASANAIAVKIGDSIINRLKQNVRF